MFLLLFVFSSWLGRVPRLCRALSWPIAAGPFSGRSPSSPSFKISWTSLSLSCGISILLSVCCLIQSFLLVSVHVVSNILLIIIFSGRSPFSSSFKVSWTFFFWSRILTSWTFIVLCIILRHIFFMMFSICILSVY